MAETRRRGPSAEALQVRVERVCEAFDQRFDLNIWKPKLHDRKAGQPMAEPERQSKLDRLEEVTIVQAAILGRLERKYDDAIQRHDEQFSRLESALEKLVSSGQKTNEAVEKLSSDVGKLGAMVERTNETVEKLGGEVQIMSSAMNGLFERMDGLTERLDRFIRGQEGNGRKN